MKNGTLCDILLSIPKYHESHYVGLLDMYEFRNLDPYHKAKKKNQIKYGNTGNKFLQLIAVKNNQTA